MRISDWSSDVCSSDLAGAGQISSVTYTAPLGTLTWWAEHLERSGIPATRTERFGKNYLTFAHPDCGVGFEIVEDDVGDSFQPWDSPHVPAEYALRGFNSWTAKVHEIDEMDSFMRNAWNLKSVGDDGAYRRYAFGTGGAAKTVDVLVDDARQGHWARAAGKSGRGTGRERGRQ